MFLQLHVSAVFALLSLLSDCFSYISMLINNAVPLATGDLGIHTAFNYEMKSIKYHA